MNLQAFAAVTLSAALLTGCAFGGSSTQFANQRVATDNEFVLENKLLDALPDDSFLLLANNTAPLREHLQQIIDEGAALAKESSEIAPAELEKNVAELKKLFSENIEKFQRAGVFVGIVGDELKRGELPDFNADDAEVSDFFGKQLCLAVQAQGDFSDLKSELDGLQSFKAEIDSLPTTFKIGENEVFIALGACPDELEALLKTDLGNVNLATASKFNFLRDAKNFAGWKKTVQKFIDEELGGIPAEADAAIKLVKKVFLTELRDFNALRALRAVHGQASSVMLSKTTLQTRSLLRMDGGEPQQLKHDALLGRALQQPLWLNKNTTYKFAISSDGNTLAFAEDYGNLDGRFLLRSIFSSYFKIYSTVFSGGIAAVGVIGVLASGSVAMYSSAQEKARDAVRIADLAALQTALQQYFVDNDSYPTALTQLVDDAYIARVPSDPNGADYDYLTDGEQFCLATSLESSANQSKMSNDDGNSDWTFELGDGCTDLMVDGFWY